MAHLSLKLAISRVAISCWLEYLFAEVEGVSSERIEPKPEKRNSTTKVNRMSDARMNMQGLLAILEDEEANLFFFCKYFYYLILHEPNVKFNKAKRFDHGTEVKPGVFLSWLC